MFQIHDLKSMRNLTIVILQLKWFSNAHTLDSIVLARIDNLPIHWCIRPIVGITQCFIDNRNFCACVNKTKKSLILNQDGCLH